ncbi:MAG: hypothetical protein A3I24_02190 [Candidatus Harrisonbacteria bacterium RIFCSPLOWO2_02_FULL_41_13b]|uniref:Uncharacterized protein n=1 Tax=Candidatus Harrisonbacteria bacterium RIFCSPLOWO2_02_FULL_41_13b TaxID=1798409 RepID=A0A1G1ZU18_9BACT|nr:MAG: hypothetical protein A3J53_03540 [Candidatus Harrisonbacteria bacterium RIFCSPHIGHO2_02_FULL_40_20]OGY68218.1 MAG: hypothetical protein A3I24_02190 [Candidatus Harrisonbacteria bacterium RIFCSPLOWO2_02_FULL_41_13b]
MVNFFLVCLMLAIWWFTRLGFGAFMIDPALLFIGGYFGTYLIYKFVAPAVRISAIRKFFVFLAPLTIFCVWAGGILLYLNVVSSPTIYLSFLPDSFVGENFQSGNDFMWNGLGVPVLFGNLVPEQFLPTYHYWGLNILAIIIWLSFLPALFLGIILGQADALINRPNKIRMAIYWLVIVMIGILMSLAVAGLISLVVAMY